METQDKCLFWLCGSVLLVFLPIVLNCWIILLCAGMLTYEDSLENANNQTLVEPADEICRLMLEVLGGSGATEGVTTSLNNIIAMAVISIFIGTNYICLLFWIHVKGRISLHSERPLGYLRKRRIFKSCVVVFTLMILVDLFGVITSGAVVLRASQKAGDIAIHSQESSAGKNYSIKEEETSFMYLYVTAVLLACFVAADVVILLIKLRTNILSTRPDEDQWQSPDDLIPYSYDLQALGNPLRR
ncbi:uncharacterized protein LOC135196286 [Macrobrachium nipponense]|uniref:uncharacterized protein LOC135196286 n=1 Tax=Macrobrachium nipponense TaxID=159736 RepID=UPI0030C83B3B